MSESSQGLMVYSYDRCSTCRKALAWLSERGIGFERVDIVQAPPSVRALKEVLQRSGVPLRKLFNTSGQSYRAGNFKERLKGMDDDEALQALAEDGKLIKRPLVVARGFALVGFNEENYQTHFAS